jgi:hypothetical protein
MEHANVAKQMITFQKSLFENSFKAVCMVMDQTEQMMEGFLGNLAWVPEDGKKSITDAITFYKKARDSYKKAVDDGFEKMEELFIQK